MHVYTAHTSPQESLDASDLSRSPGNRQGFVHDDKGQEVEGAVAWTGMGSHGLWAPTPGCAASWSSPVQRGGWWEFFYRTDIGRGSGNASCRPLASV